MHWPQIGTAACAALLAEVRRARRGVAPVPVGIWGPRGVLVAAYGNAVGFASNRLESA